jgi:hypothetical protein
LTASTRKEVTFVLGVAAVQPQKTTAKAVERRNP